DDPVVAQLADRLRQEKGIALVEYPQEWVERLSLIVLAVQWAKWSLGGVLFMATFFIVGSTVRLAVLARKDEIEIMQLVGASEKLIQAPFIVEGLIQGTVGGAIAVLSLWGVFVLLRGQMTASVALFGPLGQLQFLDPIGIGLLFALGCFLGASGSLFSLRRFLKTWRG
ncbi:MAG TPA: FtsX-like permease family protein, partial [Candidatus Binatia bacterium]|nr:FtsX-like permease family protein [Candidatus Binatia bacterium]